MYRLVFFNWDTDRLSTIRRGNDVDNLQMLAWHYANQISYCGEFFTLSASGEVVR